MCGKKFGKNFFFPTDKPKKFLKCYSKWQYFLSHLIKINTNTLFIFVQSLAGSQQTFIVLWEAFGQPFGTRWNHTFGTTTGWFQYDSGAVCKQNENAWAFTYLPRFPNCTDLLPKTPFFVMDWETHTNSLCDVTRRHGVIPWPHLTLWRHTVMSNEVIP